MRLKSIKLAGFKSFVDPTKVELRSQLTAVVGPNGCGKSNIIDAVRWVMGESSAKQLRGESLVDVIFNGSTHRPPVSQASIELQFDNSDGTLGGEYASYADIVVRRQVNRDGQSHYALNGSRCRRKDITDLFLGTGLGPRSYAIIEQGTISRLIEAKPEELRIFLEEAAGISKYKERRRETELRLNHTRDNLARLNDIREELAKQLHHLDRQAKAAERFKSLKHEERQLKTELFAVKSHTLHTEWQQQQQHITTQSDQLLSLQSQLAVLEADNSERLQQQQQAQDHLAQVQHLYMEQGAHIARLEQNLAHNRQRQQQIRDEWQQVQQQIEHNQHLQQRDEARLTELTLSLDQLEPELLQHSERLEIMADTLHTAEHQAQQQQTTWDHLHHQLVQASQSAQQKQHELQQLEREHQQKLQQRQQWQHEYTQLQQSLSSLPVDELDQTLVLLQEQRDQAEQALQALQQGIEQQRQHLVQVRGAYQQSQQQLSQQQAQLTALETYQHQALANANSSHDSPIPTNAQRLVECLTVESGYERVVERVLGHWLQALCIDDFAAYLPQAFASAQPPCLVDKQAKAIETARVKTYGVSLKDKVQGPAAIVNLLASVYVCSNEAVVQHYAELEPHITLVTPEGVIIQAGLLHSQPAQEATAGVLERQKQMQALSQEIDQAQLTVETWQTQIDSLELQLSELESQRQQAQLTWQQLSQQCHQQHSTLQIRLAKHQQIQDRCQGLQQQIQQVSQELTEIDVRHESLRETWQQALHDLEQFNHQRDNAVTEREQQRQQLQHHRQQWQQQQQYVHQLTVQQQKIHAEKTGLMQQQERSSEQWRQLQGRQQQLQQADIDTQAPMTDWQSELECLVEQRFQQEQVVLDAKIQVQQFAERFRLMEQQRREWEQAIDQQRSVLENLRLAAEATQTRWQAIEEQRQNLETVEANPDLQGLSEQQLQQQLDEVSQKIQRLGLVNLTAIEEFATQSARKTYLDEQHQDLMEAITTLENAIRTIDRETKARFQETFDQVNDNFQKLFPTVFAGGKAYLELTGDDLLDTGVAVFAQPSGKRNSTIHLLSGGEKALTAVALVFAIFQLNPAPFCMLDEVDAPLDDSNVSRFCQLVKAMMDKTQFIMVTHNKVAMEMAHQLMGVTMQEPGVSRLVAVDIQDALAMIDG